ncbi:MAG: enoyl-CoA hydratase/isomerase family protein [Gammaproteobacteria bacterium]
MPYRDIPEIVIAKDGPVAIVTMNNPKMLNAFTDDMHTGMEEVWQHLALDRSVRTIVLTGAGKAFSAGGNVPAFKKNYDDFQYRREGMRGAMRLLREMIDCPKPVIAAVNGPAVGLGCSVAVCSDVVMVAESAFMADPHIEVGLVAGDGGAVMWPLMMSVLKAKYYLLTGDRIPAAECVNLGLANFVVPDAKLVEQAVALATRIATKPQQATEETKRAVNLHMHQALLRVGPFASMAEQESFGTTDVLAAIERFTKR